MQPKNFNAHRQFVSVLILGLVILLPFALGCGGKTIDASTPQDHPANPDAPHTTFEMPTDVLTQEKAPVDDERTYTEEGTHEHHNTVSLSMEGKDALMAMLGAYFAIGDQLASDTIENINAQAHAMLEAFQALEDETPADDLHFWHAHEPEAEMIYDQGHKLAELSDIKSARIAYGSLSDGLNRLVTALGVPPGYEKGVYGFVCGMAKDIPPNGIWLQIGENVRNPYFGKAMPKCHSEQFKLPVAGGKARGRGGVGARE